MVYIVLEWTKPTDIMVARDVRGIRLFNTEQEAREYGVNVMIASNSQVQYKIVEMD